MSTKTFIVLFALLIAAIVIVGLTIDGPMPIDNVQTRAIPHYEIALQDYLSSVNRVWEEADHCAAPGKYLGFINSTERLQTAIQNGNLQGVEDASQDLSAIASSISLQRNGERDLSLLSSQKRLSQEIKKLEDSNQANYPIRYHFDLLNVHRQCYSGGTSAVESPSGSASPNSGGGPE